ncbi:oligosaccharide flippase family protein [Oxyplasma meridianum]|uniref:Oligosaccharide flippase family protein n=1 Tax=Oxyplasma meridianum TaxID=3073602 RepID=A0AAX4NF23_9ARCH
MSEETANSDFSRSVILQYASSGSLTIAGSLFYIYAMRIFQPAQVGSLTLLVAIMVIFPTIFSLGVQYGMQHYISYELGRKRPQGAAAIISKFLRIGIGLFFAATIAVVALAPYISQIFFHSAGYTRIIELLSPDVGIMVLFNILGGMLLGLQKFQTYGKITIISYILAYGSAAVLIFFFPSIIYVPVGWMIGYFIGAGAMIYNILIFKGNEQPINVGTGEIFRYSAPLFFSSIISISASYVDRFVVAFFLNLGSLGIYNLALLVVSSVGIFIVPINNITLSKFSQFYAQRGKDSVKGGVSLTNDVISMLYVPATLGIMALSTPIIDLIAGSNYLTSALPIDIILTVSAVLVSVNVLNQGLFSVRVTKIFIYSSTLSLFSNIALSYILIPKFSIIGASIGYSSIMVVSFLIILYASLKSHIFGLNFKTVFKIWGSAIVMAVVVHYFAFMTGDRILFLPLYIIAGVAIYLSLIKLTHALNGEHREVFSRFFPSVYNRFRFMFN